MSVNEISIYQKVKDQAALYRHYMEVFSVLIFVNVLVAAIGWLTQVKIANSLGKDIFGQVAFGIVLGCFGQAFIRFGLDRTLVRDLIHYPEQFEKLVRGSLVLRYALMLLVFSGLLTWKLLAANDSVSWDIMMITIGWSIISLDLQPVYDACNQIKRHTYFFLIQKACYLLLIWCLILFFPQLLSVKWIGLVLLMSVVLYLLLQHQWVMAHLHIDQSSFRDSINSGLWLIQKNWLIWISSLAALATGMLNQVILKHHFGYGELGGYAAAWQFVTIGTLFIDQITRIGRPAMARFTMPGVSKSKQISFLIKYLIAMIAVVLPLVFAMVCFPDVIILLFFKSGYLSAQREMPILGIYLLISAIGYVFSQYVISVRLDTLYFCSVIFGGILSIIFCLKIIPIHGSVGAAWAILLSYGVTFIFFSAGTIKHLLR